MKIIGSHLPGGDSGRRCVFTHGTFAMRSGPRRWGSGRASMKILIARRVGFISPHLSARRRERRCAFTHAASAMRNGLGACGPPGEFIGSHLCGRLLAEGHDVGTIDALNDFYPSAMKRGCRMKYGIVAPRDDQAALVSREVNEQFIEVVRESS